MSEKLDTLVAQKVMGWKPGPVGVSEGLWTGPGVVGRVWNSGHSRWSPTTNPDAMMSVVNRLILSLLNCGTLWIVGTRTHETDGRIVVELAQDKDVGVAVCIAALRAVGVHEADIEKARKA